LVCLFTEIDKQEKIKAEDTPIEIHEGPKGTVLLKGLKEQKITNAKDLALIYESTVILHKNSSLKKEKNIVH